MDCKNIGTVCGLKALFRVSRSRFAFSLAIVFFLAASHYSLSTPLYAQSELGSEDDLTVLGLFPGTALDPDVEIKGFTVFGSTQDAYTGSVVGPGNVVVNGVLSVSSGAYFVGNSTFTAAGKIFINDGSAGQILQRTGSGSLTWISSTTIGDNLGNHIATTTLNMSGKDIIGVSTITVSSITTAGEGVTFSTNAYFMNGRVGIGTTLTGTKLRVSINDADTETAGIRGGSSRTTGDNYGVNGTAAGVGAAKNVGLYGWADGAARNWGLWVDKGYGIFDENVGIGTATPQGLLHVGAGAVPGLLVNSAGNVGIGTTGPSSTLNVQAGSNGWTGGLELTANDAGSQWYIHPENSAGGLLFSEDATNTRLIIKAGGNVGIGMAGPITKLDMQYGSDYTSGIHIGQGVATTGLSLWHNDAGATSSYIESRFNDDGAAIYIRMKANGTPVNAMTILGSGNVGIGTTEPATKLDVVGDINTSTNYQIGGSTVVAILPGNASLGIGVNTGRVNTGGNNAFLGSTAGYSNTTGSSNTFVGYSAGYWNTTGDQNTFVGYKAGARNLSGSGNAIVGYFAEYYPQYGSANAILGNEAGYGAATNSFSSSTLMGYRAGYSLLNGSADNIFVGFKAGYNVTVGTGNIVIGYNKDTSATGAYNELNIGGVLYGDLSARTIGISTRVPQAALDLVSTGTATNIYAQIWRNGSGTIVSSMTSTGVLYPQPAAASVPESISVSTINAAAVTPYGGVNITTNTFIQGKVGIGITNPTTALHVTGSITSSDLNTANGAVYTDATGKLLITATGGAGVLCLTSNTGGVPVWGACSGSAATAWSSLTAPSAGLSLAMGANISTFTWNDTSTKNLFTLTDTAGNTGTGYLLNLVTTNANRMPLRIRANGVDALAVDAAGRVGIGTTAPVEKLVVDGSLLLKSMTDNELRWLSDSYNLYINENWGLRLHGDPTRPFQVPDASLAVGYGATGENWGTGNLAVANNVSIGTAIFSARLHVSSANALSSDTLFLVSSGTSAGQELVIVKGNGRVGIGTTAPGTRFHVEDSVYPVMRSVRTSAAGTDELAALELAQVSTAETVDGFGPLVIYSLQDPTSGGLRALASAGAVRDGADSSGALVFNTVTGNSIIERLRIANTGNVGIGTTGPTANLHVSSTTASATQDMVKVTTGTADADVFVIKGNGTVGIGTTGTMAVLDIVSTGTAANIYAQIWRDGSGTIVSSMTSLGVLYPQSAATGSSGPSIEVSTINATATTPYGGINVTTNTFFQGRVGISSTTPSYKLVVSSGAGEAGTIMAVSTGASVMFEVKGTGEVDAKKVVLSGGAGKITSGGDISLEPSGGDVSVPSGNRIGFDGPDSSYIKFDSGNQWLSVYVNGAEVARFKQ